MYDTHARPPDSIRAVFKERRKQPASKINLDRDIIDPSKPDLSKVFHIQEPEALEQANLDLWTKNLVGDRNDLNISKHPNIESPRQTAFEINGLPGLYVYPSLLPPHLQIALLDKLLHRDLSNSMHKTNLHLHHHVRYPACLHENSTPSFFAADCETTLQPKDIEVHKPITYAQMLESKLRWITLGGQYDWTNKVYPDEVPPPFPHDVAALLKRLFPTVDPQAAIVNLYSPGDTLSVHRDVSEECGKSLISISFGCDGIFLVGNEDGSKISALRLKSGDAILMSRESRYAWHGVPRILADTCPSWLRGWPDIPEEGPYQQWRGWMNNKRINLNVRQMTEKAPFRCSSEMASV